MKQLFILVLFTLIFAACENTAENRKSLDIAVIKEDTDTLTINSQWYVYNNPVNGFDISILVRFNSCDYGCLITVYLKKGTNKSLNHYLLKNKPN